MTDYSHLHAIELRASNERMRLAAATDPKEIQMRQVWLDQINRELEAERTFLGLVPEPEENMTLEEIFAELDEWEDA